MEKENAFGHLHYRPPLLQELTGTPFSRFERRQDVNLCLRKEDGVWVVRSDPFCDDWNEADRKQMADHLRRTLTDGGFVLGAFRDGTLKGFVSVERAPIGSEGQYRDLSQLYVSAEWRGRGVGRTLFCRAADWARAQGGAKLYISAHSAVETQAFYRAMGCREAQEYDPAHVAAEPFDCQMEYVL